MLNNNIKLFLSACFLNLGLSENYLIKDQNQVQNHSRQEKCSFEIFKKDKNVKIAHVESVVQIYIEGSHPKPNIEKMVEGAIKTYFLDSCFSAPGLTSVACGPESFSLKKISPDFYRAEATAFAFPRGQNQKRVKFYKLQSVNNSTMQVHLLQINPEKNDDSELDILEKALINKN